MEFICVWGILRRLSVTGTPFTFVSSTLCLSVAILLVLPVYIYFNAGQLLLFTSLPRSAKTLHNTMPPSIPTKRGDAYLTPYIRLSVKSSTPVKRTSIPSSPAEQTKTPATIISPASSSLEMATTPDQSPSIPLSIETRDSSLIAPLASQISHMLWNFGKHNGRTLSQIANGYIVWLKTKIRGGLFSQERFDELRVASEDDDDDDSKSGVISGPLSIGYKYPKFH
ncbi:hypothetical protein BKA65DRAFT_481524 [Rhexocercosporidium sp. MPI-PUGE-AT-0058]|nr:hypothetical protein BKA65DRAFT_481524 [Rhexocercosporidium sp. MPI-PUGE-AT-0058]